MSEQAAPDWDRFVAQPGEVVVGEGDSAEEKEANANGAKPLENGVGR